MNPTHNYYSSYQSRDPNQANAYPNCESVEYADVLEKTSSNGNDVTVAIQDATIIAVPRWHFVVIVILSVIILITAVIMILLLIFMIVALQVHHQKLQEDNEILDKQLRDYTAILAYISDSSFHQQVRYDIFHFE